MATVYKILCQAVTIMKSLNFERIVVVFDEALYAKAAEVTWKHLEQFKPIILRMGAFHKICNFMAIIGKRFADSGLADWCIEADVVAEGSVR